MGRLDDLDLSAKLDREEYEARLAAAQAEFLALRLHLGGQTNDGKIGPGLLVVIEGSDAGGKGGAVRRIVERLDPRHFDVYAYAKPTEREKRHHFLWRFWSKVPGLGGFCVFDRSWYGRVLVERVEGFATEAEWRRAYHEIVEFERSLVAEGVILVKFWLQVSKQEQLERFESRREDPFRRWKLNDEDWRNRDKWDHYTEAIEDMFAKTDHDLAPWDVISGEQKKWARVMVLETLNRRIREGLERYERDNA
ncbi:MAG TPA: UDP-galactose-lipid carrier transferase [Ilumatobacteraceae bacterium]|nr:UDP-galactose-lipid carrier transferase [Ilumatobacteraceae bacterium]